MKYLQKAYSLGQHWLFCYFLPVPLLRSALIWAGACILGTECFIIC